MKIFTYCINSPSVKVEERKKKKVKENPLTWEEKKHLPREDFKKNRYSLVKGDEI